MNQGSSWLFASNNHFQEAQLLSSAEELWRPKGNDPIAGRSHKLSKQTTHSCNIKLKQEVNAGFNCKSEAAAMECPHTYHPKLDTLAKFWKRVQETSLQAFTHVRWNPSESHWYFPVCKSHILQAVLRKALASGEGDTEFTNMKRGPEADSSALYVFSIDSALEYQLTPGERDFLKTLNLEDFITSNSWGVLHTQLVTEAIATLAQDTFLATVKGEKVQIIAENWREQFRQTFHLNQRKAQPVTKKWQLMELFPTAKEAKEDDTVRISDCQHPSARRPLRLLSSLLCLNPTHQNHIALSFVEMVVSALNGEGVDWPQEFYHELTEELTALHEKHSATKVKVEKTSVGPHITLILRAKGVLDIREELEAGYRSEKALTLEEQLPNPKKSKTKEAKEVPEMQPTIRVIPSREKGIAVEPAPQPTTTVYSVAAQPAAASSPKAVILETSEKRAPPNALPAMVEQIVQAHRRLENLLISFTIKAPHSLVNKVSSEFFKIQREATLREDGDEPPENCSDVLLKSQGIQLNNLAKQLENAESLNVVNIETIFNLQEEVIAVQNKLARAEEEVLILKGQKRREIVTETNCVSLTEQITKLEARLTNAEELIDLYVENSFEMQTLLDDQEKEMTSLQIDIQAITDRGHKELNTLQEKLMLAEEEVLGLKGQKGEALHRIGQMQQMLDTQTKQMQDKDEEIIDLNNHFTNMNNLIERQDALDLRRKGDITRLESQITDYQKEIAHLTTDNHKLTAEIAAGKSKRHLPRTSHTSKSIPDPAHPITGKEDQALAAGVASKLLHELRRDLARSQQEKADLARKLLQQQEKDERNIVPQTHTHPSTEIYQQMMAHTKPSESIMQCHRIYGGLNLILSNVPLLKTGCNLAFDQVQEIWSQANAAARDTLVFMWCLGDLKTPLGTMEMLTGSPPFYIKRYILRCIKLLCQHHTMASLPREPLPTLRSYPHGQHHFIKKLQQTKIESFRRAMSTLAAEDTAICFEAVQQYQALRNQDPKPTLQPTLSELKDFVNSALEAQQSTLTNKKFGAITSGTLLFRPRSHNLNPEADLQSMGTCFL